MLKTALKNAYPATTAAILVLDSGTQAAPPAIQR